MYARIATFQSDPADLDQAIEMVRHEVESDETPPGLQGARMLMLVDRQTGKGMASRCSTARRRCAGATRR